jgi:hypothetical protein
VFAGSTFSKSLPVRAPKCPVSRRNTKVAVPRLEEQQLVPEVRLLVAVGMRSGIQVALHGAKNDLQLAQRRDLQTHMAWAARVSVSPPDDAIRGRLARLFKAVAGNESSADEWPDR